MSDRFVLVADKLTKQFGSFRAVDELSIEIERGEIFGFLGANGAGKTTAIRMFCGLLEPSSGSAHVAGCDIKRDVRKLKRKIGYMSQKFSLYEDLTVAQNIELYGGLYEVSQFDLNHRGNELLKRVGLTNDANRRTADLPLGYKQRLVLGCCLLHRPEIVFLDEPTSGVDPQARRVFWDLIYEIAHEGTTVFVTTHYMEEAEYCNRISLMVSGKLAALDTPTALKRKANAATMQDAFLRLVQSSSGEVKA